MTTVAIFGGTGYAGGAIAAEAARRGLRVASISRNPGPAPATPGVDYRQGSVHDATLVDQVAAEADVIVVAIRYAPGEGGVAPLARRAPRADHLHREARRPPGRGRRRVDAACRRGRPAVAGHSAIPREYKGEAGSAADALEALRADTTGVPTGSSCPPPRRSAPTTPGQPTGTYRIGGDILLTDESGKSEISGADYALAFVDEIDTPAHHRTRFTVAY